MLALFCTLRRIVLNSELHHWLCTDVGEDQSKLLALPEHRYEVFWFSTAWLTSKERLG